jgi:hypothetical protein
MESFKDLREKEKGKIEILSSQSCLISGIFQKFEQSGFVILVCISLLDIYGKSQNFLRKKKVGVRILKK